eukprot:533339-Pyramimonas_sp.AAC.2
MPACSHLARTYSLVSIRLQRERPPPRGWRDDALGDVTREFWRTEMIRFTGVGRGAFPSDTRCCELCARSSRVHPSSRIILQGYTPVVHPGSLPSLRSSESDPARCRFGP